MLEKNISPYNTRLFKENETTYELRIASSLRDGSNPSPNDPISCLLGSHQYKNVTITITRGDYSPLMNRMVLQLQEAKNHSANDNQSNMIEYYIQCFTNGSIDAHKEGSRYWIKDKGPVVETYIGFIESYRDPYGVRGEYEGFVAIVNKEMSRKFTNLVSSAETFLPLLPWPKEFEKDVFLRPDFTSLDVIAFGSSGIPAGINIPNYDDIRQNEGFKNVSLGNVLSAAAQDKRVSFVAPEDQELYTKLRGVAFEVQVGLHELLGHGSGKLFKKKDNGEFNFDKDVVTNPLNGSKISSWYNAEETWDTVFSTVASSYEECRAECVGIYLSTNRDILKIFGHEGCNADDVMYINWLNMLRSGLLGLEFYTPQTKKWRQAHMQARYVIMRVLMECDPPIFNIDNITGSDGKPDLIVKFDRTKLESVGRPVIGEFLKKLQVYKSIADFKSGQEMYDKYSTVTEEHLTLRDIVMSRKMPRRLFVQPHTLLNDSKTQLQTLYKDLVIIVCQMVK
jgi:dipeptidyl-peptidase-3